MHLGIDIGMSSAAVGGPLMAPPGSHNLPPVIAVDAQLSERLDRKKALFREHSRLLPKELP